MKYLKKSLIFTLSLGINLDSSSLGSSEFTYEQLYRLIPFAPVSIRGAVSQLKEESIISAYQREGLTRILLTSTGREQLRTEFEGLRVVPGKRETTWTVCLFLDASESKGREAKPILRPVRARLLEAGFLSLERGMYVYPGVCPASLVTQLSHLHALHRVLVFETKRLVVGDERAIVRSLFDIKQISKASELLSKSLSSMAGQLTRKEKLHPQTREAFILLLPKLMEFFSKNVSIPDNYFPQEIRLSEIKQLLSQVSAGILPKI